MNALFLTTFLPNLMKMGSEVASQGYINAIEQAGHNVTVMGHLRTGDDIRADNTIAITERPVETKSAGLPAVSRWLFTSFRKGMPYCAAKFYCAEYVSKLRSQLSTQTYDVVIVDHCQMAWLLEYVEVTLPVILITQNVEHRIYAAQAAQENRVLMRWLYSRDARLIRKSEEWAANRATQVWTLADEDNNYYSAIADNGQAVMMPLPSGADTKQLHNTRAKNFDIGLIGSWSWKPNHDALRWFLKEVHPHIPEHFSIHVAGSGANWIDGKYKNVEYRGFVENPHVFLQQARVIAIPALHGSGIQIKTLEAISSGSPIVSTQVGLRGIPNPPRTVHRTESPREFSELLQSLLSEANQTSARTDAIDWSEKRARQFQEMIADYLNRAVTPQQSIR